MAKRKIKSELSLGQNQKNREGLRISLSGEVRPIFYSGRGNSGVIRFQERRHEDCLIQNSKQVSQWGQEAGLRDSIKVPLK